MYNPINWKNRAVEHKHRYEMSQAESAGLVYLTPAPGEVDEPGTPINADNLNHMDEAILAHDQKLDELEKKKVNISGGDISDTVATLDETAGDATDNIASGESLRTILSKIYKVIRQFFIHKSDAVIHTTKADKDKLAGIEEHANNYVHPDTHPAGMITSDANHRFVTDDKIEAWDNSLSASKTYADGMYRQATAYADKKVADLIGGAPESLDTLKEVADAIKENASVMDALDAAVGKKANQSELDTHVDNSTIHITSQEREKWNGSVSKTGDASNTTVTFTESTRVKPTSGEKLSVIVGKIVKWLADLKTVAFSGSYNDLNNIPSTFNPAAHTHTIIVGQYTGSGGRVPPSYVGANAVKCNMMNGFEGLNTPNLDGYMDVLMMNAYCWNDVPYATALGIKKGNGGVRAWIANGGNTSSWSQVAELLTSANYTEYAATKVHSHAGINDGAHSWTATEIYDYIKDLQNKLSNNTLAIAWDGKNLRLSNYIGNDMVGYTLMSYNDNTFYSVNKITIFKNSDNILFSGEKGNFIVGVSVFSDARLKKNVKRSKLNAIECINEIEMCEYDFIDEKYGEHSNLGYIAQQLQKVIPECVVAVPQDKEEMGYDELLQVQDTHLIPYLVKAIQELSSKVAELEKKIDGMGEL